MSNIKSYMGMVLDTYTDTYKKLYNKYSTLHKNIDISHDQNKEKINEDYYKAKNDLSVSAAIDTKKTKESLLNKGLSKSGDSIQAETTGNMAKNVGLAALDAEKNKALRENEVSRSQARSQLYADYMDKAAGLDEKLLADYIKQMNADRDYEYTASRDSEEDRRWQAEFDAERKDADREYGLKQSELTNNSAQQAFENEMAQQELKLQQDKAQADIAARERELDLTQIKNAADAALKRDEFALKEETSKLENAEKSLDIYKTYFSEKSTSTGSSTDDKEAEERLIPKISAASLVDKIYSAYYYNPTLLYNGKSTVAAAKSAIAHIIANRNIDYDYRYEVKVYAKSLGLYD